MRPKPSELLRDPLRPSWASGDEVPVLHRALTELLSDPLCFAIPLDELRCSMSVATTRCLHRFRRMVPGARDLRTMPHRSLLRLAGVPWTGVEPAFSDLKDRTPKPLADHDSSGRRESNPQSASRLQPIRANRLVTSQFRTRAELGNHTRSQLKGQAALPVCPLPQAARLTRG